MYNTLPTIANPTKQSSCDNTSPLDFENWLYSNGYPEDGEKLTRCANMISHYACPAGHNFYYRQFCGREYCPICGAKDSYYHKRRVSRAAEHFLWESPWGNLVYTMPKHISESHLSKRYLRILQKAVWEITRDNFGIEGVSVTIHLLGRAEKGLHVHFEVLFCLTRTGGKGLVPQIVIEKTKKAWRNKLNEIFKLDLDKVDVRYSFAASKPKKWHKLNYIHRSVCTEDAMLKLSDDDKRYILSLKGFHRNRYFGAMAGRNLHKWLRKYWAPLRIREIPAIERRVCPICKVRLRYQGRLWITDIPYSQVEQYNDSIWVDRMVAAHRRSLKIHDGAEKCDVKEQKKSKAIHKTTAVHQAQVFDFFRDCPQIEKQKKRPII